MSKYRFKTKEEFIRDGRWVEKFTAPYGWGSQGKMNKYLGTDIPDEFNKVCDDNKGFKYNTWYFEKQDYVLKEQQEYFNDLSQHIGRYIKALVDYPHCGSVKKGEIGKIISKYAANFPNQQGYGCSNALSKGVLGVRYELLPEDYSPEQEIKKSSVEFIPGKWYNFTTMKGKFDIYVKVDFFTDKELYFKDGRYICNKSYDHASGIDIENMENLRLVEDLSEIQEYLPEGHPDKITKQRFEIGKWYKWYQKNHGNYHCGKVNDIDINTDTFVMKPWIMQCNTYSDLGHFDISKAEQIQEISVEEVQEFLPNSHPDKITSDEFKKGEYIVIIKMIKSYSKDFTSNYIYKQREDYKHLRSELDNYGSTTNGWETIGKKDSHTWRYATQEEIDEYERRGKPYNVTELNKQSFPKENITEVPEYIECFIPYGKAIKGKVYKTTDENEAGKLFNLSWKNVLIDFGRLKDGYFKISNKEAYEKQKSSVPEYIEAIDSVSDYFISGKIYKVKNSNNLTSAVLNCNDLVNFSEYDNLYINLTEYRWKPSTKEAYEQQKLISVEEPNSLSGSSKSGFILDEVGQYPSTASNYWKNVPKFVEQDFDIYGPTPDIE